MYLMLELFRCHWYPSSLLLLDALQQQSHLEQRRQVRFSSGPGLRGMTVTLETDIVGVVFLDFVDDALVEHDRMRRIGTVDDCCRCRYWCRAVWPRCGCDFGS
eukprot:TRINITY_DN18492_c0_g1_i1.p2 TRINITY_DN18492_c0_g1~~TRINITY_DN18492_c0_g1_i1.p2  ORF type:complete len:103 (-),score=5.43 TRINITY_DN18492_c0_g1_i1:532-840(-)